MTNYMCDVPVYMTIRFEAENEAAAWAVVDSCNETGFEISPDYFTDHAGDGTEIEFSPCITMYTKENEGKDWKAVVFEDDFPVSSGEGETQH